METNRQKTVINILYFMLIALTVFASMPSIWAQFFSAFLMITFLGCAHIARARDKKDGLVYNHMTYMIGTFWASSTVLIIGLLAAGFIVYVNGDNTAIDNAVETLMNGGGKAAMEAGMETYKQDNKTLLTISSIIGVGPAILYFIYRVGNGYGRAMKGYRIANPKSWL